MLQNGRLLEEQLVAAGRTASVGGSPRSTVVLADETLPGRWRLFEQRRGRRWLRLAPAMEARLAVGHQLTAVPAAPAGAGPRLVALAPSTRGRISIGDVTILFQLLGPVPPRPRPQLPASVRASLRSGLDRWFSGIALASLVCHLALVLYLRGVDWPRRPDETVILDRFARVELRPLPRIVPPAASPAPVPTSGEAAAVRKAPPAPARARPRAVALSTEERRRRLVEEVNRRGLVKIVTALGDQSALADLLRGGGVDVSQEEAFRGLSGVAVAGRDDALPLLLPRDGAGGKLAQVGDLRGGGQIAAPLDVGPVRERRVDPVVRPGVPTTLEGQADPATIAREIRQRLAAVRACYERALKRNPRLGGKLVLRIAISPVGTVSAVAVDDDTVGDPELGDCLRSLILRWRFAPPAGGAVEIAFPFVFQPEG